MDQKTEDAVQISEIIVFNLYTSGTIPGLDRVNSHLRSQRASEFCFRSSNIRIHRSRSGSRHLTWLWPIQQLDPLFRFAHRPTVLDYLLGETALSHRIFYGKQGSRMAEGELLVFDETLNVGWEL